ncbi:MAG: KamA family radical SAM protein [Candidatus Eiseniibacteriota bacterium]|nr:MAG: KamA family radical SAM protein [Candidatus Eisenbacteria bacterium]
MDRDRIRTIEELEKRTHLTPSEKRELSSIIAHHPMAVTEYYANLIDWDDPDDPLRKMAIPSIEEHELEGSFDTSGEQDNTKYRGLQHKYAQTGLVLMTNSCWLHCRYCFRKRLVGVSVDEIVHDWSEILQYLRRHTEITNVLLSGGDPLTLPTSRIVDSLEKLADIPHLNFVRIGTRAPVVHPSRITEDEELVKFMRQYSSKKKRLYIITHFNHPREITPQSSDAVNRLTDSRMAVINQTVLLRGINDDPAVLAELQSGISKIGVAPYYIFQCRPVRRVKSGFQVPLREACKIIEETRSMLDGIAKRFRFVMSHETGKIEILGSRGTRVYFRYHQSKDQTRVNEVFLRKLDQDTGWIDP